MSEGNGGGWFRIENGFVDSGALAGLSTLAELKTYLILKRCADRDNSAFPSIDAIARLAGIDRGNVSRGIAALVRQKLVARTKAGRRGQNTHYGIRCACATKASPFVAQAHERVAPAHKKVAQAHERVAPAQHYSDPLLRPITQTKEKDRRARTAMPEIPLILNTPEFVKAWSEWLDYHRSDRRKSLTPCSAKRQLDRAMKWGIERAITAIDHSITNAYQGLYEPKGETRHGSTNGKPRRGEGEYIQPARA